MAACANPGPPAFETPVPLLFLSIRQAIQALLCYPAHLFLFQTTALVQKKRTLNLLCQKVIGHRYRRNRSDSGSDDQCTECNTKRFCQNCTGWSSISSFQSPPELQSHIFVPELQNMQIDQDHCPDCQDDHQKYPAYSLKCWSGSRLPFVRSKMSLEENRVVVKKVPSLWLHPEFFIIWHRTQCIGSVQHRTKCCRCRLPVVLSVVVVAFSDCVRLFLMLIADINLIGAVCSCHKSTHHAGSRIKLVDSVYRFPQSWVYAHPPDSDWKRNRISNCQIIVRCQLRTDHTGIVCRSSANISPSVMELLPSTKSFIAESELYLWS